MKIDPKLKYLAETAARDEEITLSAFVERAIRFLLEFKTKLEYQEPGVTEPASPKMPAPMWGEGFWDEAEADRFFKRAAFRYDLLTDAEKKFWQLFQLCETDGKGIEAFRDFWNHPMIDTQHLAVASEEGE